MTNNCPLPATGNDLLAWEKAQHQIKANRCGELIVRVVNEQGQPLSEIPIAYHQKSHDFEFGLHYPYDPQVYDIFQELGFNAATLWLGWKHVQPTSGHFNWRYLDRVWNPPALHKRGISLTAHSLVWFNAHWQVLPDYIYDVAWDELPHLTYTHVRAIARHWAPYIHTYEIINEPFWNQANVLALSLETVVKICKAAALAIRDTVPEARLRVNLTEPGRIQNYQIRPLDFFDALDQAGVHFDVLGIQVLENCFSSEDPPRFFQTKKLSTILSTIRKYATIGRPIIISAFGAPSTWPQYPIPESYRPPYGPWDEDLQARYAEFAYTLFFAEPAVQGITWWSPVDGPLAYIPSGGLIDGQLEPKPAYDALHRWFQTYTSSGTAFSDGDGKAVIRGYAGTYQLRIGKGAQAKITLQTILPGQVREATLVLQ